MVELYYKFLTFFSLHVYPQTLQIAESIVGDNFYKEYLAVIVLILLGHIVLHKILNNKILAWILFILATLYSIALAGIINISASNAVDIPVKVIMVNITIIIIIFILGIISFIAYKRKFNQSDDTDINSNSPASYKKEKKVYTLKNSIFTINEQNFYLKLKSVIDTVNNEYKTKLVVFTQVRVLDIIKTEKIKMLENMHIDFVLCDALNNYKYVAAIELDDSSHNKSSQIKNDQHKDNSFKYIKLPLIRFQSVSHSRGEVYQKSAIFKTIFTEIPFKVPSHEHPLILRKSDHGQFFGCSKFPECEKSINMSFNLANVLSKN